MSEYSSERQGIARKAWYYEEPKRLYWGQLSGSDAALYTAPSAPTKGPPGKVRVDSIWLCNTDTAACTVTLQIRTGASAATTHILSAYSVAANTSIVLNNLDFIMEAAEIISGLAGTASKMNVRISGTVLMTLPTG
jgi:hypothetical protein